jgi:Flp pilus assembly protein TadD
LEALHTALTLKPGDAQTYDNLGVTLVALGGNPHLRHAHAAFTRAQELAPARSSAVAGGGVALQHLGEMRGACGSFVKAA